MAYGTLKVDNIIFTNNGSDQTTTVSGLYNAATSNITVTGTISGNIIQGQTVSGVTVTGTTANFASGVFTTSLSGATVTGNTGSFSNLTAVSGTFTTLYANGPYSETIITVGALAIDCGTGNYFIKTINGNSTFTVSNVPSSRAYAFTLELTHTSGTITWFSGVEWPNGTAPTLTTGKTHLFMFVTDDGGTRWRASSLINYTN